LCRSQINKLPSESRWPSQPVAQHFCMPRSRSRSRSSSASTSSASTSSSASRSGSRRDHRRHRHTSSRRRHHHEHGKRSSHKRPVNRLHKHSPPLENLTFLSWVHDRLKAPAAKCSASEVDARTAHEKARCVFTHGVAISSKLFGPSFATSGTGAPSLLAPPSRALCAVARSCTHAYSDFLRSPPPPPPSIHLPAHIFLASSGRISDQTSSPPSTANSSRDAVGAGGGGVMRGPILPARSSSAFELKQVWRALGKSWWLHRAVAYFSHAE
jgi:hypothetical protein